MPSAIDSSASSDPAPRPHSAARCGWTDALEAGRQRTIALLPTPLRGLFRPRLTGAFGILMYHRVTHRVPGQRPPTSNVSPPQFRRQLTGLLAKGYCPWPLRRALDAHRAGQSVPRNVFVVTFDDGYANNCTQAWPILRELGVPATIFLATAHLDTDAPFPFEDWEAAGASGVPCDAWRPLTSAECCQMLDGGGIELGAHTHTHEDFRGRPEAFSADLQTSLAVLRDRFGQPDATFAFPFGKRAKGLAGGELREAARRAGVLCALTSENELVLPESDPFDWGRFTASEADDGATLAAKLDGWYSLLRGGWRRISRK